MNPTAETIAEHKRLTQLWHEAEAAYYKSRPLLEQAEYLIQKAEDVYRMRREAIREETK